MRSVDSVLKRFWPYIAIIESESDNGSEAEPVEHGGATSRPVTQEQNRRSRPDCPPAVEIDSESVERAQESSAEAMNAIRLTRLLLSYPFLSSALNATIGFLILS